MSSMPGRPVERRVFLVTLVGGLLARPPAAAAKQPGKIFRVGHLAASAPSAENTKLLGAFQAELRKRGWVDGLIVTPGGLISWSADSVGYWRQAAIYADRILRGASPADLPVEQPTKFDANQPPDRQGARPDHSTVIAAPGGRGDRVGAAVHDQAIGTWLEALESPRSR